jgi:hypothetical protein
LLLASFRTFAADVEVKRGEEITVTGKVELETRTVAGTEQKVPTIVIDEARNASGEAISEAAGVTVTVVGAKAADVAKLAGKVVEVVGKGGEGEIEVTSAKEKAKPGPGVTGTLKVTMVKVVGGEEAKDPVIVVEEAWDATGNAIPKAKGVKVTVVGADPKELVKLWGKEVVAIGELWGEQDSARIRVTSLKEKRPPEEAAPEGGTKATVTGKVEVKTAKVAGKDTEVPVIVIDEVRTESGETAPNARGIAIKVVGPRAANVAKLAGKEVKAEGKVYGEEDTARIWVSGIQVKENAAPGQ